jgi:hypothetical protein
MYDIERHRHLFAAWAASRAASVKGCRFTVLQGRTILEAAGFDEDCATPECLPTPQAIDDTHRRWRADIVKRARARGLRFTHGVAAKLINCYLKSRFVCGRYSADSRVQHLHPPIDNVLLTTLAKRDIGGYAKQWREAGNARWSKFTSDEYEKVICLMRQCLRGKPLWRIEEYWPGNQ